ncbi:MAG: tripartite tricarboxylate transporter substrate binding protein [Betaproteobacteria bacterium]|nr:tripartite tricarboxylate transporter substrate binding protein [Betaproteobacteria bacterium]
MKRRIARSALAHACVLGCTSAFAAGPAPAQNYPDRPVRLILASAPGGGTDTMGRILASGLSEVMGQQFVPENRAGAGGQIAITIASKSPSDGYTLLFAAGQALVIHPHTYPKLPYNVFRDLAPISIMGMSDYFLAVHPSLPVRSVQDLIALARLKPGAISFGSSGHSSIPHLAGELFKQIAKVDMLHVPFKGGGPAVVAILSGEISLIFGSGPTVIRHGHAGKLRLVAVAAQQRSKLMPELPAFGETLKGLEVSAWYSVHAPAGAAREIVLQINQAVTKAVALPKVRAAMAAEGIEPMLRDPGQVIDFLKAETAKWGKVVKAAGMVAN